MKIAFVFPGQGAQSVGMGRDLYDSFPAARAVFDLADSTLGFALSRLCFEGPEAELMQTINAQPAILSVSLACLEAARSLGKLPQAGFVAGHSLGEYTALAAAGVLEYGNAIYLARERGRLMHQAGQATPGGMAAVIGLDAAVLEKVCAESGAYIANINCPGQIAISGAEANLTRAMEQAKAAGAARVIRLQVSGAFHTPLMQPAAEGMKAATSRLDFKAAAVPIVANTTGLSVTSPADIKAELLGQLTSCVRWQKSVEYMLAQGISTFVEVGPGKVLAGLIKRTSREPIILNIGDAESVKNFSI